MIVLHNQHNSLKEECRIVLLFGVGLVGSSIYTTIEQTGHYSSSAFPFNWTDKKKTEKDIFNILEHLITLSQNCNCPKSSSGKIAFIWSAGKAGFSTSQKAIDDELFSFESVLGLAMKTIQRFKKHRVEFHLLSSVGGLFEGSRLVDTGTQPSPQRPYGMLKEEQEKRLTQIGQVMDRKVYRPTSVYGYSKSNHRMGLIPTLILSGIRHQEATIVGDLSTLRDYILNEDLGRFIVNNLFCHDSEMSIDHYLLGSGKPSTILEIQHLVEREIGRKINLKFSSPSSRKNNLDITVRASSLPTQWKRKSLQNGIRYVKECILSGWH